MKRRPLPLPTAAGAALLALGVALPLAGRLLGVRELYEVGVGLAALAILALLHLRRERRPVRVERSLVPGNRISAGASATVQVTVSNPGRPATPLLRYEERAAELLGATVLEEIGRLRPGETTTFSHRLAAPRRGVYRLGPASLIATDPFRLAREKDAISEEISLFVYPRSEPLAAGPVAGASSGTYDSDGATPASLSGEFFAIREYSSGDEARKIHWRSTARMGRLMVRQEQHHHEPRAAIILDNRMVSDATARARFESAVSSAASLIRLFYETGFACALVLTCDDPVPFDRMAGFSKTTAAYHAAMERLAVAELSSRGDPVDAAKVADGLIRTAGAGGDEQVIVSVTTSFDPELAGVLATAPIPAVIVHHRALRSDDAPIRRSRAAGVVVIEVDEEGSLAPAWNRWSSSERRVAT